ncbi:putative zinc-binding protein [Desulfocastanea catecholica]
MNENNMCASRFDSKLIFACSGASDVGSISDQVARKLMRDGTGKMICLAGVAGRVSGIMATTSSAAKILVINGCSQNCAQQVLEQAGFTSYIHLRLADLGMEKGQSPVTPESIEKVAVQGAVLLE